jgi:exodeoxyribonuclease-3
MRLYSWNVNGMRAIIGKGFWDWFGQSGGDVVCLQETKAEPAQLPEVCLKPEGGYVSFWNHNKLKKGHSGVGCLTRIPPLSWTFGLPQPEFQGEGRLIRLEFESFYLFNIYFPNSQSGESRLNYKLGYYDAFLAHAQELRKVKPIVVCGDFNTAHREADINHPERYADTPGFLPIERAWMDRFIAAGYVDTFRMFQDGGGHYTWWSYFRNARARNSGWRIDYFFVSEELAGRVRRAWIEPEVMGSDHCPVAIDLDV